MTAFTHRPTATAVLRSAVTVLAALSFGGCAVGPAFQRPAPPVATHFVSATAVDARSAPAGAANQAQWWAGFADPLLLADMHEELRRYRPNLALPRA